ncbi:hypothetical protein [Flagellimonas iocasae]|uniref:Lipoprotein n=1 Tax=Flagellimonas iocasae TaxID=2055905 RepID=A0ABW4XTI2_9FLAO
MKIKPVFILSIALSLFLVSCVDGKKNPEGTATTEDFATVTVPKEYSIRLPRSMQKTTALNSDASLQYQNIHDEIYTIIIDEPKQEFVDASRVLEYKEKSSIGLYRDIQLKRLSQRMDITYQSKPSKMTISGLTTESVEIDAKIDNIEEDLTYFLTFIEGNDKIYMIMSWTLKSKKQRFKNTFLTIVKSFKVSD